MPYTGPILFYGNKLAVTISQPTNVGNKGDARFEMKIDNAAAIGGENDLFRLSWTGNTNGYNAETFSNGQFWTLERYNPATDSDHDPLNGKAGWSVVYDRLNPKPDLVQGMGMGQEYIVMDNAPAFIVYDVHANFGMTQTTLRYAGARNNGDLSFGRASSLFELKPNAVNCFTAGTRIETVDGLRPVEGLAVGDLVLTRDHGAQPVRWIGKRRLSGSELENALHLRPIRIRAGALRDGVPATDLVVSPLHRILLRSTLAVQMFDTPEILVPARKLLPVNGVELVTDMAEVTYVHFLFDRHEVVFSNGAETESFYPGPGGLASLDSAARNEILGLFPELIQHGYTPAPARPFVNGGPGRRLVALHLEQGHRLVD